MKPTAAALFVACATPFLASAQAPNPLSSEMKTGYATVKNNLLQAAEKMPEENYGFKPVPEIRSFAEVLWHVVSAQTRVCGAVLGDSKPAPPQTTSKAGVIAALNSSFAECDKAYDALTDSNATDMIQTPRGSHTRFGTLGANVVHDTEQYAILGVYLRLKGIVPPSSDAAGSHK